MKFNDVRKLILKVLKPLKIRTFNLVRLGMVKLVQPGLTQNLQVFSAGKEIIENAKFIEPYGLTAKPLAGSECIVLNIQGNPANPVVITVGNRQLRVQGLKDGEVCLYDNSGNRIDLKNGGEMVMTAPNKVTVNTKQAIINAESVDLGGPGGLGVACLGDAVKVDPDTHIGTITAGSSKVRAVK